MESKKKINMLNDNIWKSILIFSLPLMLSNFLQVLFNLSDIAVVGHFAGSSSLGAVGSTAMLINLFTGFLIGLGGGVNVLVARYLGAKDDERLVKTIGNSFLICLIFGFVIMLLGLCFGRFFLELLDTKEGLIDKATTYFRLYMVGMPAIALYNYGSAIYSALGNTKRPLIFLSISGAINIAFNLLFVIAIKMDVAGVALASVISQYLSAILVLLSLHRRNDKCKLSFSIIRFNLNRTKELLKIGLPAGVQCCVFAIANLFIQGAVNTFDEVGVEGNSAAMNYDALVYDIMAAFYMAGASFTGQNYGAGNKKRIKTIFFVSLAYSFCIGLFIGLQLFFFGEFYLSIFTSDPAVIEMGLKRLSIMGLSYAFSAFMDTPIAISRGLGKAVLPTIFEIIGSCIFRIIWVYTIFAYYHTMESLYLLYIFSWMITALGENIYLAIIYKKLAF